MDALEQQFGFGLPIDIANKARLQRGLVVK